MTNSFEKSLIESYNKKANVRNSAVQSDWKVKEREIFCDYIKWMSLKVF